MKVPVKTKYQGVMAFKRHFQQYFSYIVAVSLIGGGKRSSQPLFFLIY
jgi:hypothetical protein